MFAIIGLVLWFVLPIKLTFPPFLLTALLALGYGTCCLRKGRSTESNNLLHLPSQKTQPQVSAKRGNDRAAKDRF